MNALATVLLLCAAPAQVFTPEPGAGGQADAPLIADVVAFRAINSTEPGIDPDVKNALSSMADRFNQNTLEAVAVQSVPAPIGRETAVQLNERYTLIVAPLQALPSGEIDLAATVRLIENGRATNALDTRGKAALGKPLLFRGLPSASGGELGILLKLRKEQGDDSSDSSEDGQGEESEEEQEQQQDPSESEESEGERESDPKDQGDEEQEAPEPEENEEIKDMQNIEAILESLEEQDRREQEDMRKLPSRIRIVGDWW